MLFIRSSRPFFTHFLFRCIALVVLGGLASSCAKKSPDSNVDGPVTVQIPENTEGSYTWKQATITTLQNLKELRGLAAHFLVDVHQQGDRLGGLPPQIQTVKTSGGTYVATDALSLQLMTIYVHLENLMKWDAEVGAQGVNKWPRTVAVNVRYQDRSGYVKNNAMYSGTYDSLLFVPYTEAAVPLMVNAGVIGHEHFHSLFQKLVVEPLHLGYPEPSAPTVHKENELLKLFNIGSIGRGRTFSKLNPPSSDESDDSVQRENYHAILLRGLNEGLADFWGWIYSDDLDFVSRSLPSEKMTRSLSLSLDRFITTEDLKHQASQQMKEDQRLGLSYILGNQYAQTLYAMALSFMRDSGMEKSDVKKMMARKLIDILPHFREVFRTLKEDEYLNPSKFFELYVNELTGVGIKQCNLVRKLILEEDRKALSFNCQKIKPEQPKENEK